MNVLFINIRKWSFNITKIKLDKNIVKLKIYIYTYKLIFHNILKYSRVFIEYHVPGTGTTPFLEYPCFIASYILEHYNNTFLFTIF